MKISSSLAFRVLAPFAVVIGIGVWILLFRGNTIGEPAPVEEPTEPRPVSNQSVSVSRVTAAAATATVVVPTPAGEQRAESRSESPLSLPAYPFPEGAQSPLPTPVADVDQLDVQVYTYEVIQSYPHDPQAFTQGLIWFNGYLYEGTGLRGRSSLRKVNLANGTVLEQVNLPEEFFGEGITIWEDKIFQLTWRSNTGFIYTVDGFEQIGRFEYPTEGWGLTHDGTQLIMSDGTATLYFLDPDTFVRQGTVSVTLQNQPVDLLNELEYIDGLVYANIWKTHWIAMIEPSDGTIVAVLNLSGLLDVPPDPEQPVDVLNGIAYDESQDRLFVTGKLWPRIYEIKIVPNLR